MKEQFVSYNLALKLKELGFKDKSLGFSYMRFKCKGASNAYVEKVVPNYLYNGWDLLCIAPLWQQAFDFIRNKYLHSYSIHRGHKKQDYYYIFEIYNPFLQIECESKMFDTYEEARLACLEKLIELCKKIDKI